MLREILDGSLFGFAEVAITVPEDKLDFFSHFPPIFKNVSLKREDLSPLMQEFAVENDLFKQPQRSLIGFMFGKRIALITPLLQWYIQHGLVVTKIYLFIQFKPKTRFKDLVANVAQARRGGNKNIESQVVAEIEKLVGNSGYGYQGINRSKQRDIRYSIDAEATQLINNFRFHCIDEVDPDLFEVTLQKTKSLTY